MGRALGSNRAQRKTRSLRGGSEDCVADTRADRGGKTGPCKRLPSTHCRTLGQQVLEDTISFVTMTGRRDRIVSGTTGPHNTSNEPALPQSPRCYRRSYYLAISFFVSPWYRRAPSSTVSRQLSGACRASHRLLAARFLRFFQAKQLSLESGVAQFDFSQAASYSLRPSACSMIIIALRSAITASTQRCVIMRMRSAGSYSVAVSEARHRVEIEPMRYIHPGHPSPILPFPLAVPRTRSLDGCRGPSGHPVLDRPHRRRRIE